MDFKTMAHNKIGKHNNISDSKFNKKQLAKGKKVEKEHTNSKTVAKNIAKDHLSELPDYYDRLEKMEEKIDFKKYFAIKEQNAPKFNTFYHVTPSENTPNILKQGLIPQQGERAKLIGEDEDGIYLFRDVISAKDALMNWLGDEFDEAQELDLLKIMLPVDGDFDLEDDPDMYEVISRTAIPAENVYLLKKNI